MENEKFFEDEVRGVFAEVAELVIRKHRDYSAANINAFGLTGILVRLSDKLCRLRHLHDKKKEATNESVMDSYMDIMGYAGIAIMLMRKTFDFPLREE